MLTYEKCKELKEADFPQTALYDVIKFGKKYARPSFEEIWNILAKEKYSIVSGDTKIMFELSLKEHYIECINPYDGGVLEFVEIKDNNITEAAADLWLLLKKENLL